MRVFPILLFAAFLIFCRVPSGNATEEYAMKTGKDCAACHVSPSGGGELTAAGKEYAASLAATAKPAVASNWKRAGRLTVGYLHLLTAILWFGTILYVHLVLKPAYAVGGLPRGEVRVGLYSMIVIGVTGAILVWYRIDSAETLLHTRFGVLLLAKIALYLVMVLAALVVVILIGPRLKGGKKGAPAAAGAFSAADLAYFDGKEGRPAYFAWAGMIYDASKSAFWKQGMHMGRHHAGTDLTDALEQAPHGAEQLSSLPVVGQLAPAGSERAPLHQRAFYFLAYLNLTIVFLIVFIVSLWRFW